MKKNAVIDVGSNSVRLMFVADGKVLYKALCTTRLGEGIVQRPVLKAEAITRTAEAVKNFYVQAQADGAQAVYAFATAAVRTAENGNAFVQAVQDLCGLHVAVIDGKTEAEIGVLGALGDEDGAIIDVGGASTEIAVRKNDELIYKKSVDVGVVRLKDACNRDFEKLNAYCLQQVKLFKDVPSIHTAYAIGGTATTVGAQILGLTEYNSNAVTGTKVTLERLQMLADKLAGLTVEETKLLPCMPAGRADVLLGGVVWLLWVMKTLNVGEIIISDRDNLEGYAIKKGLL